MQTKDILIFESGDGGELAILNGDLALVETLYTQTYLALFGGNIEANTIGNEPRTDPRFDWWANELFEKNNSTAQFNSDTERALQKIVLNNAGRNEIIRTVESDLQYLNDFLSVDVDVTFPALNKIEILVKFKKENKVLQIVYDNAKNQLIIFKII